MELSAKTLWPLFPLLLLLVVVCLTWALVASFRRPGGTRVVWIQGGALGCYLLAAITAVASESGALSSNVHRPFSLVTQLFIAVALFRLWGRNQRSLVVFNIVAWAGILSDTALHYLLTR